MADEYERAAWNAANRRDAAAEILPVIEENEAMRAQLNEKDVTIEAMRAQLNEKDVTIEALRREIAQKQAWMDTMATDMAVTSRSLFNAIHAVSYYYALHHDLINQLAGDGFDFGKLQLPPKRHPRNFNEADFLDGGMRLGRLVHKIPEGAKAVAAAARAQQLDRSDGGRGGGDAMEIDGRGGGEDGGENEMAMPKVADAGANEEGDDEAMPDAGGRKADETTLDEDEAMKDAEGGDGSSAGGGGSVAEAAAEGSVEGGGDNQEGGAAQAEVKDADYVARYCPKSDEQRVTRLGQLARLPTFLQLVVQSINKTTNSLMSKMDKKSDHRPGACDGLVNSAPANARILAIAQVVKFRLCSAPNLFFGEEELKDALNVEGPIDCGGKRNWREKAVGQLMAEMKVDTKMEAGIEPQPKGVVFGRLTMKCFRGGPKVDCSVNNMLTGHSPNVHPVFECLVVDQGRPNYGDIVLHGETVVKKAVTVGPTAERIIVTEKKGNVRGFARVANEDTEGLLVFGTSGKIGKATVNLVKYAQQEILDRAGENGAKEPVFVAMDQNPEGLWNAVRLAEAGVRVHVILGLPETTKRYNVNTEIMKELSDGRKEKMRDLIERSKLVSERMKPLPEECLTAPTVNVEQLLSFDKDTLSEIILKEIALWEKEERNAGSE